MASLVVEREGAFARAGRVVELEIRNGRCAQAPLENRIVIADWDALYEELTVTVSHQAPHLFRTGLAEFLDLSESRIRVVSPDVGGGFGGKLTVYPEDLVTCALSRLVGKPVCWSCDRRQSPCTPAPYVSCPTPPRTGMPSRAPSAKL